jgi:hypothetical protein
MSSFPDFNLSMSALRRRNALLPAALSQSLFDLFDPVGRFIRQRAGCWKSASSKSQCGHGAMADPKG